MSEELMHQTHRRALDHVASLASGAPLDPRLRITVNFHPDRGDVLEALARDGAYYSQFVTGTSSGGLTAYPGGDRWRWEHRMFAGAYDQAPARLRPVYGALNFRRKSVGAAPRFGSAHLRLHADTLARATFCYPDSHFEPTAFGVASRMSLIELALADPADELDDYVEAQVHGPVRLDRDVEAFVLDPSYRGTDVETVVRGLPCPLQWHAGFRVDIDELRRHPDYRGPQYVALAIELAADQRLDPRAIGDAARTRQYDEQDLKKVWHYLARFGIPARDRPD
jgi:hypothetical protein